MKKPDSTIEYITTFTPFFIEEGLSYVGVFGSQARGEAGPDSDIDVLIDYDEPKSLFDLARINIVLEDRLNKTVDLVTRKGLKPALKKNIEQDLIQIYAKE